MEGPYIYAYMNWFQRMLTRAGFRIGYTNAPGFTSHLRGYGTTSGVNMDVDIAMGLSTVYACVHRVASTVAQLHVDVLRRNNGSSERLPDHPIYNLIAVEPQPGRTAYDFWEAIVTHVLLYGKGYAIIHRDARTAQPIELELVHPQDVTVRMVEGTTTFVLEKRGTYLASDMLCIRNLYGISPIETHRELLGLAKAAQDYASEFFGSSGNMTGILSSKEPLKKEQLDIIKDSWNNSGDRLGTKLLPFGFNYQRVGVDPSQAQMSEQRDFQNQEICRVFGVPPSLVGVQSNVTYSNTEQQAIQFAKYTIVPWTRKIEQEMNCKLVATEERVNTFTRFDLADLLRGDSAARANYYDTLTKSGIISINEARAMEDMPPVENGSEHLVQVNQIALSSLPAFSAKLSESDAGN